MIIKKDLLDNHQAYIEYDINEETWNTNVNQILLLENQQTKIPGFRLGKAPLSMIANKLGEDKIFELASEEAIRKDYAQLVKDSGLEIYRLYDLRVEKNESGLPLYKLIFDLKPTITLKSTLNKLKVELKKIPNLEAELEDTLSSMQDSLAKLNKLDDTHLEQGQVGLFSTTSSMDEKNRRIRLNIGKEEYFPGFDSQVIGMLPGEEREVVFASGNNEVKISVKLESNYQKELPPIDDELAKKIGYADLKTLTEKLEEKISLQLSKQRKEVITNQVFNQLLNKAQISIPKGLLEEERDDVLAIFIDDLKKRGLTLEAYLETEKKTPETLQQEALEAARKRLEVRMLIDKLAGEQEIEISEEELNLELEKIAQEENQPAKSLKAKLKTEDRSRIINYLKREKMLNLIPQLVKIKEV